MTKRESQVGQILKGAVLQTVVKSADQITFNVWYTMSGRTDVPRQVLPFWYGMGPLNVHYDDWYLNLALPAGLALIGKLKKSEKIMGMAIGASLTGLPLLLNQLLSNPAFLPLTTGSPASLSYVGGGRYGRTSPLPVANFVAQRRHR